MLYDGIFKELMNPETAPENLNEVLSLLLGKKVEIIEVMPGDNSRLGSESSLLVMDIVVRLEDGSLDIVKKTCTIQAYRTAWTDGCPSSPVTIRRTSWLCWNATRILKPYMNMHTGYAGIRSILWGFFQMN